MDQWTDGYTPLKGCEPRLTSSSRNIDVSFVMEGWWYSTVGQYGNGDGGGSGEDYV